MSCLSVCLSTTTITTATAATTTTSSTTTTTAAVATITTITTTTTTTTTTFAFRTRYALHCIANSCLSVCLPVCLSVCLPACLFLCRSVCLCAYRPKLLYVGDHMFADILRSKRTLGWRTCLIVPELEGEMNAHRQNKDLRYACTTV